MKYTRGNKLNEHSLNKYDVSGNLIEQKRLGGSVIRYSGYKTDAHGNWTERTATFLQDYQGKELKKVIKYFRKIEYYK